MKNIIAYSAIALSLSISPVISQTAPEPETTLPTETTLPVGEAVNFAFIAPVVGSFLAFGALAGGNGDSTPSTPSTN